MRGFCLGCCRGIECHLDSRTFWARRTLSTGLRTAGFVVKMPHIRSYSNLRTQWVQIDCTLFQPAFLLYVQTSYVARSYFGTAVALACVGAVYGSCIQEQTHPIVASPPGYWMSPNLIGHIGWLWDPVCIDIYVSKIRLLATYMWLSTNGIADGNDNTSLKLVAGA